MQVYYCTGHLVQARHYRPLAATPTFCKCLVISVKFRNRSAILEYNLPYVAIGENSCISCYMIPRYKLVLSLSYLVEYCLRYHILE